ncbi:MAG: hypothetical protein AAB391_03440 [Patescibacteria group bacterium]
MIYKRIIITGDAGRGKSTLAAELSRKFGIPSHSTDDYFYEVKFSKPRDRQQALEQISETFKQEKWIVEGTTAWLLEPGMASADIILYLRYKNILSQWGTLLRRGLSRENERIKQTLFLMKHVFYKRYSLGYKKGKMTHQEFIEPHKHKVVTLSSFKEIEDFLRIGLLSLLFLFCPTHVFAASTSSVDFVRNQIWFSKQPFRAGEQVKIYTSVLNGGTADTRGSVEFYDDQTLLGTTQFSVLSGGSQIVWVRWLAASGEHRFRAKIVSIHATYPDGREEDLPDIESPAPIGVFVLEALPPPPKSPEQSAAGILLGKISSGPLFATSTIVGVGVHGAVSALSATDSVLNTLQASLEKEKGRVDERVASPTTSVGGKTGLASVSAAISSLDTPFHTLYSYLLHFLTFILDHKTLIYLVSAYVLYKAIRYGIRRFSRRAV